MTAEKLIDLSGLDGESFQSMVGQLLLSMGFEGRCQIGEYNAPDDSRDFDALWRVPVPGGDTVCQRWRIEAKFRSKNAALPRSVVEDAVTKARAARPPVDFLLFVTNRRFSEQVKASYQSELEYEGRRLQVLFWEAYKLEWLLLDHPLVLLEHLGVSQPDIIGRDSFMMRAAELIPSDPDGLKQLRSIKICTHTAGEHWEPLYERLLIAMTFLGKNETRRRFKIVTLHHDDNEKRVQIWKFGGVDICINDHVAESPVKFMIVETASRTDMIIGWARPEQGRASPTYWPAELGIITSKAELVKPYNSRFDALHGEGTKAAP